MRRLFKVRIWHVFWERRTEGWSIHTIKVLRTSLIWHLFVGLLLPIIDSLKRFPLFLQNLLLIFFIRALKTRNIWINLATFWPLVAIQVIFGKVSDGYILHSLFIFVLDKINCFEILSKLVHLLIKSILLDLYLLILKPGWNVDGPCRKTGGLLLNIPSLQTHLTLLNERATCLNPTFFDQKVKISPSRRLIKSLQSLSFMSSENSTILCWLGSNFLFDRFASCVQFWLV